MASPADLFGSGPRSQALGATAALARGHEAAYGNPAQLSDQPERRLTLGYTFARFNPQARSIAEGALPIESEALHAYLLGLTAPVPLHGDLYERLAVGLSVLMPSNVIARVRLLQPETPQFPLLSDRAHSLSFNLGVGANLGHGLRVGLGAVLLAELLGEVSVGSDRQNTLATRVDDELLLVAAPVLGVSFAVTPELMAGVSYRGELRSDFDLQVTLDELGSVTLPDLNIAGTGQYDSEQLQAEIGYQFGNAQLIAGALFRRSSRFPGFLRATVECPSTQPCEAREAAAFEFVDTLSPRVGAAYRVRLASRVQGELRAGYFFEPSPLASAPAGAQVFDSDRHGLTLGYGIDVEIAGVPLHFDWAFQKHLMVQRSYRDATGTGRITTGGSAESFSLALGATF